MRRWPIGEKYDFYSITLRDTRDSKIENMSQSIKNNEVVSLANNDAINSLVMNYQTFGLAHVLLGWVSPTAILFV